MNPDQLLRRFRSRLSFDVIYGVEVIPGFFSTIAHDYIEVGPGRTDLSSPWSPSQLAADPPLSKRVILSIMETKARPAGEPPPSEITDLTVGLAKYLQAGRVLFPNVAIVFSSLIATPVIEVFSPEGRFQGYAEISMLFNYKTEVQAISIENLGLVCADLRWSRSYITGIFSYPDEKDSFQFAKKYADDLQNHLREIGDDKIGWLEDEQAKTFGRWPAPQDMSIFKIDPDLPSPGGLTSDN